MQHTTVVGAVFDQDACNIIESAPSRYMHWLPTMLVCNIHRRPTLDELLDEGG